MDQGQVRAFHWRAVSDVLTKVWDALEPLRREREDIRITCNGFGPDGRVHPTCIIVLSHDVDEHTSWYLQLGFSNGQEHHDAIEWDRPVGFPGMQIPIKADWSGRDRWDRKARDRVTVPGLRVGESSFTWGQFEWPDLDSLDAQQVVRKLVDCVIEAPNPTAAAANLERDVIPQPAKPSARPEAGAEMYDVGLTFAGEQRVFVEEVARQLDARGVTVYYDRFHEAHTWGKNLVDWFEEVFARRCRYVVMFASAEYAEKEWPTHERRAAQARALKSREEYILPVRFDNTDIPGMPDTVGYLDASVSSPEVIAELVVAKLEAGH